MTTERYVFDSDLEHFFYEKLDNFHDIFVIHSLLCGVADKGVDLESIKMSRNPSISLKYCERVVGGLTNTKPQAIVELIQDRNTVLQCIFSQFNDSKTIGNYTYMVQNVMDYPQLGKFSCQIWYLGEIGVDTIKDYWK